MEQTVQPLVAALPTQGRLSDLLHVMGAESDDRRLCDACLVPIRRVRAGAALFHEGTRAESVHVVRIGTFKILRLADDGYEQVLGFAGQGEVIGFDALCSGTHPSSALALEDSTVYALPVRELESLRRRVAPLDRALQTTLSAQLANSAGIAEVMAAVASEVRLARFLLQRSARMQAAGQSPRRLRLPMSRRDIASHLGVAHETVSRSFGELAGWGYLSVDNREVEILDPQGLRSLARNTRGFVEERPPRAGLGRVRLSRGNGTCARPQ
jgi:CRP/FNR family transcriptional regulator